MKTAAPGLPPGFEDSLVTILADGNADAVIGVFAGMDLAAVANGDANRLLQLIAKYGYSGRTDRYARVITHLLNHWEPGLGTCALLGLGEQADALLRADAGAHELVDSEGATPLHHAAERGSLSLTETLISAGADVSAHDSSGQTPLDRALHAGPMKPAPADDVVSLLRQSGAAVDLCTLAALGDTHACQALITSGETADTRDARGCTALFRAVHNNRLTTVQLLLRAGADPNAASDDGQTPLSTGCLHALSQECDPAIVQALIESGAQMTPVAAVVTETLKDLGRYIDLDPELLNGQDHESLLGYAIHTWRKDALRLLLRRGAIPTEANWRHIERIAGDDKALVAELRALQTR